MDFDELTVAATILFERRGFPSMNLS